MGNSKPVIEAINLVRNFDEVKAVAGDQLLD
jgi:hypothetical protein